MKKIFTPLALLVLAFSVSEAQQKSAVISSFNNPSVDRQATTVSSLVQISSTPVSAAGGSASIWEEDFGGGFPAGWAVDDISGINPWKWSTNGSHGNFNNLQGAGYDDPINSTTSANGFLINDPDSANNFTYGQPSSSTYQYLESYFATNEIDLGASYSSLLLEFEQSFRFNNGIDMVVQVSSDSTNWTDYTVQGSATNNSASDDPDLVSINISGAIGSAQSVFLRIGWSARVYFWMIDDMRIIEGLDNDLAVTDVWHGDVVDAFEYQKIPLEQAQEVVIGAACLNLGGTPQTNTTYAYDISRGATSVASGSFAAGNVSITSTGRDTTWYATGYTPTETGDYTVTVSVSSDGTDELPGNNEGESSFEITDFIYAHDDEDNIEFQVSGGEDANGEANEFKMALYYEAVTDFTLTSVQTAFGNNTTTSSCIVEVFDAVNDQSLSNALITEVYDLVPGDVSPGAVPTYVNILVNDGDGIDLPAGLYLVSIGNTGADEDLWILASDGDEDRAQLRYGPFGVGNAIDWYTGYTDSPMIRVNADPTVGIVEASLEENGFGIYPNPAQNNVTVVLNDNFDVTNLALLDAEGRVVMDLANDLVASSSQIHLKVEALSPGIYFVRMVSTSGVGTQKVVLQ